MNEKRIQSTVKKAYSKPSISEVKLRPEEAVLGFCKLSSGGDAGPGQSTCTQNVSCTSLGS